jgi:hypothetical protein
MINQAFIDAFEPDRRSEYARQHARRKAKPVTQTGHVPGRDPLRSAGPIAQRLKIQVQIAQTSHQRRPLITLDGAQRVDARHALDHQELALLIDLPPHACDPIRCLARLPQQLQSCRIRD